MINVTHTTDNIQHETISLSKMAITSAVIQTFTLNIL